MKEDKIHAIPQVAKNNSSSNIANNIKKVPPITPKIITIFPNISRVSSTEDDEVGDSGFGNTLPSTTGTVLVILRRFVGEMLSRHAIFCRG